MAADVILAPEAELDIAEAYAWYESRRPSLGEEFLSCVDACMEVISRTPGMHPVVHENYRRGLVRRFPYAAFYEHSGGCGYDLLHLSHRAQSREVARPARVTAVYYALRTDGQ